ncbi:hypothetical protein [Mitsuaria sp. PDC51]|uniref:hypothetical protein n=1 Tax=Mitsuaria sp. PDC51 TaxID=1881035 RepID=UPI0011408403|nr:hypothetical protein [Mitsuaria sp. PDC51]
MNAQATAMPKGGISLDPAHHLFIVDVDETVEGRTVCQRRAFLDFGEALAFAGERPSRLSAFFAPLGPSTDSVMFGTVQQVFASRYSGSYALTFANAPSLLVRIDGKPTEAGMEPCTLVYPPAAKFRTS